jgi:hypothetical protein
MPEDLLGPDYERIAMCAHPDGMHEHIPLKRDEPAPQTCFADCDCTPVIFIRADVANDHV